MNGDRRFSSLRGFVASGFAISVLYFSFATVALAQDCSLCAARLQEISEKEAAIQKYSDLLGKNRDYLSGLTPAETKAIKVNSNIVSILLKMDVARKEVLSLREAIQKEGCEKCQKPSS